MNRKRRKQIKMAKRRHPIARAGVAFWRSQGPAASGTLDVATLKRFIEQWRIR